MRLIVLFLISLNLLETSAEISFGDMFSKFTKGVSYLTDDKNMNNAALKAQDLAKKTNSMLTLVNEPKTLLNNITQNVIPDSKNNEIVQPGISFSHNSSDIIPITNNNSNLGLVQNSSTNTLIPSSLENTNQNTKQLDTEIVTSPNNIKETQYSNKKGIVAKTGLGLLGISAAAKAGISVYNKLNEKDDIKVNKDLKISSTPPVIVSSKNTESNVVLINPKIPIIEHTLTNTTSQTKNIASEPNSLDVSAGSEVVTGVIETLVNKLKSI